MYLYFTELLSAHTSSSGTDRKLVDHCSLKLLINRTIVYVLPPIYGSHMTNDHVTIVYAASRYISSFEYILHTGDGSTAPLSLTSFGPLEGANVDLANMVGGRVVHRYKTPGTYTVAFVVTGRPSAISEHADPESMTSLTTVTVVRRRTLQVRRAT